MFEILRGQVTDLPPYIKKPDMKIKMINILLLFFAFSLHASHPRIYTSNEQKGEIKDKIRSEQWAAANYAAIKESVEKYVLGHKQDPEWIVSRLQMYWENKYQDVYVNGSVFSHGDGKSPVPTPKFAGGRDWAVDYLAPAIEDIKPYMDDERGMWLQNGKKDGDPWEWAPLDKTGQIIERINERIMALAENAAFIYWLTGDEDYAKFAADIFWTYTNGMYHRNNPKFFKDDRSKGIVGLATFEVIHEAVTVHLAVTYDYLYDYLVKNGRDVKIVDAVFKRWADRIIEGGGAEGNWNINQARYIVYMGLSIDDNEKYDDGKGRQYYLDSFLLTSRPRQKAIKDVINDEYDPDQAIWPEAPGYAFGTTQTILKLACIIKNATGNDILKDFPIVEKAYLAYFQYLFPNGFSVGFGDTYHDRPESEPLELLVSLYRDRGDEQMETAITAALRQQIADGYDRSNNNSIFSLTAFADKLKDIKDYKSVLQTPTYYSRPVNMFIQRNGEDASNALCATLTGTAGGHVHANGMTIELYGLGMVMAPDAGRGSSYWQKEHGEYYAKFPAHNTVIVDGVSDYNPNKDRLGRFAAYRINACEPQMESTQRLNANISFIDASFIEPKTDANQRRQLAIIRTSAGTGYYVDIFRSARQDGGDKFNDYIYHNIGTLTKLTGTSGKDINIEPTNFLTSQAGLLKGYDYFQNEKSGIWNEDIVAVFETGIDKKGNNAAMKMWCGGFDGTTIFTVDSPVSRATSRGSIPSYLREKPVPAVIVRRGGQAWTKPFFNIYEPFYTDKGSSIKSIRRISDDDDLAAVEVNSENGTQYILSSDSDHQRFELENITFEGSFAVVGFDTDGKLSYIYLGRGRYISAGGYGIDAGDDIVSAGINLMSGEMTASADSSARLIMPVEHKDVKISIETSDGIQPVLPHYIKENDNFKISVRIGKCFGAKIIVKD